METIRRYDIVRRENAKAAFWLEGATELSTARARVQELLSFWPGEYQIFDLATKEIVPFDSLEDEVVESSIPSMPPSNAVDEVEDPVRV
jgi:hypothetical protein